MERSASVINSYSSREKERETLSVLPLPLHTVCYLDLLSGECIRDVTRDEGIVDGGSEGGMAAGQKGSKREGAWG